MFLYVGSHAVAGVALVLAVLGCSPEAPALDRPVEDEPGDEDELDESNASEDAGGALADDGPDPGPAAPTCPAPEFPQDDALVQFESLEAQVVDERGQGVPGTIAQVCGLNLCLFGETDATGFTRRNEPAEFRRVAFKYGDGLRHAQFARLLTDGAVYELGQQATVALPALSSAPRLEAGSMLESGGVRLDLRATAAKLDLLSYPDDEEHVFVASEFDPARWPEAVPSDQGLEMLFALGPLKTTFCPPAPVRFPNTPGWPPEAELELLLHIVDTANHWGPYGSFSVVATAHVDADGNTITTDPDSGLPELGVIALRLAE
jgi:hypothetical protein